MKGSRYIVLGSLVMGSFVVALVLLCVNYRIGKRLVAVDTMSVKAERRPVITGLNKIGEASLCSDCESAYCNLLKPETLYRLNLSVEPDSIKPNENTDEDNPLVSAYCANHDTATYTLAALHYYNNGCGVETGRFLENVSNASSPNRKMGTLRILHGIKNDQRLYKEAAGLSMQIANVDDSLRPEYKKNGYGTLQRDFEEKLRAYACREKVVSFVTVGGLSAMVVLLTFVMLGSRKLRKLRMRINDDRRQICAFEDKIHQLEKLVSEDERLKIDSEKEMNRLRKEITAAEERYLGILASGRRLLDEISDGGTTVKWTKDDMRSFVEYYKLLNPQLVSELDTGYGGLTYKAMTFVILDRLNGGCDEKLSSILGIQPSSVRSQRSRIEARKV